MDNGLRGTGAAFLVFFESVARLTADMSVNGRSEAPSPCRTMP